MNLPKAYNPKESESKIYNKWEKSGYFNPDNLTLDSNAESYTISMPPPNATGVLHVGHTLGIAIQDTVIRYQRMTNKKALMVPGTDHAAIATQNVVEKILRQENKTKYDLGREKFLARVNRYVEQNKGTINNQTRKMGASCDWSREAFTMSNKLSKIVSLQFKKMYDEGLIYRGERIVNWCPRCHSTLSDDEVEHKQQNSGFWTFRYSRDFPISIATTRPETKLGDTGVAVNPQDKRYKQYIGKEFNVDFLGVDLKIKIIDNNEVDPNFGTGALGVTPAHSIVDWEMAQDNQLEVKKVIGQDGKILSGFGEFSGQNTKGAGKNIVAKLKQNKLMEKEEKIENNLSLCYRCGTHIEPLPSLQWFIGVDREFEIENPKLIKKYGKKKTTLKDISLWAVRSGEINIVPDYFKKTYFHWMENLRDWCISRQIWFGHRVPVFYHKQTDTKLKNNNDKQDNNIFVGLNPPSNEWIQDGDTLDTWFSSALWTWSTLLDDKNYKNYDNLEGWIENSPDLDKFHPTELMETMHDILFFWVARMIMMTLYSLGEIPFKNVYLHGMVQDKKGRKMSKSHPETCIEPIEVSEKYGTDALRLSMIVGNSPGTPLKLSEEKIAAYRNFANKLWNIGRFIQLSVSDKQIIKKENNRSFNLKTLSDKWIVSRLNHLIGEVTEDMEKYRFGLSAEKIYNFTWSELADWYVEIVKIQNDKNSYLLLLEVYTALLKLLHPFTPFVTEKIWEFMGDGRLLMVQNWPDIQKNKIDVKTEQDFALLQNLITAIRAKRKENKVEPKKIIDIQIAGAEDLIDQNKNIINHLTKVNLNLTPSLAEFNFKVANLKIKI